jgi:Family of unknown function (DUF6152)
MSRRILGITAMAMVLSVPAFAHHSFSMFDHEKVVSVSGTVKELEWANPHVWLHIVAQDAQTGGPADWAVEMASVGQISRQGWRADIVKPGDKITVRIHPLKDGSHGGQYLSATLANGYSFKRYEPDAAVAKENTIQ